MKKNTYLYTGFAIFAVVFVGALFLFEKKTFGVAVPYNSSDTRNLPHAKQAEVVALKDGDTYEMTQGYVAKTINGEISHACV